MEMEESMGVAVTSGDRVRDAVALRKSDRVPVGHGVDSFAARYAGITQSDWWYNHGKATEALMKTYKGLGPWDTLLSFAPGHPLSFALTAPMRIKLPGRDLPPDVPMQFDELELMSPEDYDIIITRGYTAFTEIFFPRLGIDSAEAREAQADISRHAKKDLEVWKPTGVHRLIGTKLRLPFDWFAYARSFQGFAMDLHVRPRQVIEALDATLPVMLESTRASLRASGSSGVFVPMARGSATFISPKQFEQFCWPWVKKAVTTIVTDGCVPVLHCDSNWTPRLHYFRELPSRSCILQLDEQTDIFKAKEVLGDHMCIMGNVGSSLLVLASPDEVERHCRHLVKEVGDGGGFILSSACTLPVDATPENVKAMTRAVYEERR